MNAHLLVSLCLLVFVAAKPLKRNSSLCHVMCHAELCDLPKTTECASPELDACEAECSREERSTLCHLCDDLAVGTEERKSCERYHC